MSHLSLIKDLDGRAVTFLRFEGPDRFVVQVDGVERTISRDTWRDLPERTSADFAGTPTGMGTQTQTETNRNVINHTF
jgi:hypothetical protein